MPDKAKISTTHAAQTTKINNGNVSVKQITIKKPPKPLFVLFAYAGKGAGSLRETANYKRIRLEKKYPNAEIRIISGFKYQSEFKAEWTKLYKELTRPQTANKYSLWQIHYFGHGAWDWITLKDGDKLVFDESDNMELLPWHPDKGIFVLHSCRAAAYEDSTNDRWIRKRICLANRISVQQKTRCLGQLFYASFSVASSQLQEVSSDIYPIFRPVTTAEQDAAKFIYRPDAYTSKYVNGHSFLDRVLWAYALMTGETYTKMKNNEKAFMERLNRPYPIAEYVRVLSRRNQIMPCRIFNKGVLEHNGKVALEFINKEDLEYI